MGCSSREASFFTHFSKLNLGLAVVLAGDVASHRVHDDSRAEHDEQHRDDELQAVGDKHRAPGRLARGDGDGSGILDGAHHGHQALHERRERDAKHDDERREEHLVAAARDLEEDAQRDEHERREQLVGRAEQRPDVGVADLREHVAEHERQYGGEIRVAQELAPGLGVGHVVHTEKLLEAHARDTRDGVKAREGEGGDAHRHKDRGGVVRHAEHLKEARNAAAEDLERGTGGGSAVRRGGRTGHAECEHGKQALEDHRAVADLEHVLLVFDRLGRRAGGDEAVEAGHRAAGDGDEQDGEHRAELFIVEAREDGEVHRRMRNEKADDRARDHADEHEGSHVVARLLQKPHRENGGEEDVDERDVAPSRLAEDERAVHADGERGNDAEDAEHGFLPAREVQLLLHKAEDDGEHHEHDGHHTGCAVGLRGVSKLRHAVDYGVGVERAGDHVGERRDDDQAEQPAEQQKQLAAELADVLFDQHAHGLAVIFDGSVQRAEVRHSAEEDAAEQHPQQHRQPAERGGLNRAGDRARARDGGKLMAEDGPAVGGDKVLAVVILDGGRLRLGVDAPGLGEPAPIECVGGDEDDRRDQHDDECVHVISLSFLKKLCSSPMPGAKRKAPPLLRIFHNENPSQRRRPISRRYPPQISTSALPLCLPENRPLDRCPNGSESVPC